MQNGKVKVAAFSVSLDGYGAGADQSRERPLGRRGEELHEWIFPTRMFEKMYGQGEGTEGTDNVKESLSMEGNTVFHFVTDGIESALEKARVAANGKDIRIGGGTSTIRQFLQAGYISEMHLAIAPVFLGAGEHLFAGINLPTLGFTETQVIYGGRAMHVISLKK